MASTYSTNLALELMATGDQSGSWGNTTNTNLGTLLEQAVSGYVTQAITDGADTVITIPNGASGTARNMYIEMTGALTGTRNMLVPTNKKLYFIYNNTTGGYAVTVKVSGQTGVSVPNGAKVLLVNNGTDIVIATNYFPSIILGTALQYTYGGTGVTAAPTSGQLLIGNGTGYTLAALTGTDVVATNGAGSIALNLSTTGVSASTYNNVTVDTKGRVTNGSNASYITGNQTITLSSDATGSGTTSIAVTLANSGVTAGTYNRVTVDAKGRATSGTQVVTETVYNLTGTAIDPANGTIQYKTQSGNTTYTESLASGQSVTLMLNSGGFTTTFPTTKWRGGAAPTITSTAGRYSVIELFKANTGSDTLYAAYSGDYY